MTGLDAARGVALGAACAGSARALLKDALESSAKVVERLETMRAEFQAAMFLTGSRTVADLSGKRYVLLGETREWLSQLEED